MWKSTCGKAHVNLIVIALAIAASGWLVLGQKFTPPDPKIPTYDTAEIDNASSSASTLQLRTFKFISPTPAPNTGGACNHDNGVPAQINNGQPVEDPSCFCPVWLVRCENLKCVELLKSGLVPQDEDCNSPGGSMGAVSFDGWCAAPNLTALQDGVFCLGKPVIYLYPQTPTLVDVSVETTGEIIKSDPLYPDGGWKNVLANPNGDLFYEGKQFKELFYESSVSQFKKPLEGLTLTSANLSHELDAVLTKLGLIKSERDEFLEFWVPKLRALNSPFIQFSLIEPKEKEKIDHVNIVPSPDTRIEILAYFKPLLTPYSGPSFIFPQAPKRTGFVMVEWGATIDNSHYLN